MSELHCGGTLGGLIVSAVARFGDAPAIAAGPLELPPIGRRRGTLYQPVAGRWAHEG
jgi:hypothetical protein